MQPRFASKTWKRKSALGFRAKQWEASSSPTRERLCAEYRTLIEDLAAEIEAALASRIGGQ
jgi:hypothetical protein